MATKGASNLYGNAKGGRKGHPTKHISYAWAKGFNKNTIKNHFNNHGKDMGYDSIESYEAHAVSFANHVDRTNYISFVDKKGSTYKYNTINNDFVIVNKKGIVITYFKPKEGKAYYDKQRKRRK